MGAISVISAFATVILLYCSIIITNLKGLKKGKKFLFIALIPFIICIVCKTADVRVWLQTIFIIASIYPGLVSILSIFTLFSSSKEDKNLTFVNLITFVLCVILLFTTGMKWSNKTNYSSDYGNYDRYDYNKDGEVHGKEYWDGFNDTYDRLK